MLEAWGAKKSSVVRVDFKDGTIITDYRQMADERKKEVEFVYNPL